MRENRPYGSEGGEAKSLPYPYHNHRRVLLEASRSSSLRKTDDREYGSGVCASLARDDTVCWSAGGSRSPAPQGLATPVRLCYDGREAPGTSMPDPVP